MRTLSTAFGIAVTCATFVAAVALPASAQAPASPRPVAPAADGILGPAENLPDRFVPVVAEADRATGTERVCPVSYRDPRDGTVLHVVRSTWSKMTFIEQDRPVAREVAYGDYWVPGGPRYGVDLGRALRVDCRSGKAVGIVARFDEKR